MSNITAVASHNGPRCPKCGMLFPLFGTEGWLDIYATVHDIEFHPMSVRWEGFDK